MIASYTELSNPNKTTSNCNKTYILFMNGHKNGRCVLTLANVSHLDVTESHLHLYLHMSSLFNDQPISCVDQHPYLGVTLTSNMSFSTHIQKITAKATSVLNFIKCNLYNCSKEIKSKAYLTLVHPILEYASPV